MASLPCFYCKGPVNPFDLSAWKRVTGFVGGVKKNSMKLSEDTGEYAHEKCVIKAMQGLSPDQPSMFDDSIERALSNLMERDDGLA